MHFISFCLIWLWVSLTRYHMLQLRLTNQNFEFFKYYFFCEKNRFSFLCGQLERLIWEPFTSWGISEFTVSKNEKTGDTWKNLWSAERQYFTCSVAWVQGNTTSLLCGHAQGDYALQTWENSLCLLLQVAVRINILQKVRQNNEAIWESYICKGWAVTKETAHFFSS